MGIPAEFIDALFNVLSVINLVAIFLGLAFGVFMGAVPGLTGTMGMALIIPLTYALDPVTAFCILLGCYKGCLFSGCIPAILINTPGTPAAAATVLDGYPLAKKGMAGKALSIALWSSVIGDLIAMLVLFVGAYLLVDIATQFGPAEYAMLVLFALTVVAGVSGRSLLKGFTTTGLGFLLATIGLDPMTGTPRLTFGAVAVLDGISLMALLVGLFAISEILMQAQALNDKNDNAPLELKEHLTLVELLACRNTIVRGSIIGVILGAIPGLGATPAAFLSYADAKRRANNADEFGKGALEGVAASESANNATCGGALIPLLSLGVPGDVTTAVLLGAFLIHGLVPGPALFQDNLEVTYAIFIALLFAMLMLPLAGIIAIRVFSRFSHIAKSLLLPMIALLSVLGVYSFNSNFFDVWLMLGFGFLGFVLRKLDFPLAPMVIGFVLEPIGESAVRQALNISSGKLNVFLSTPICVVFFVLSLISIMMTRVQLKKMSR